MRKFPQQAAVSCAILPSAVAMQGGQLPMERRHRFMIVIEASEEGGYHAWCPSLPGCHSQGETLEEAKRNVVEAIECHLESFRKEKKEFPKEPEEFVGSVEVSV
jgi:predicted RNase H-like HicB family nuclease